MKKKTPIVVFFVFIITINAFSTHYTSGEIRISHIQGLTYRIQLNLIADFDLGTPPTQTLNVYNREGASLISTLVLPFEGWGIKLSDNLDCGLTPTIYENYLYEDTVLLDPIIYNDPGGYLFQYQSCCRNINLINVFNSGVTGIGIVSLFPPVVDSSGNIFVNSSPVLNGPIEDLAVHQWPYFNGFGGYDPDGDSLAFELYTPFQNDPPSLGAVTALSHPFKDPSTQFNPIVWENGYGVNNQITGFLDTLNKLTIEKSSGEVTMVPDLPSVPTDAIFGVWCKEFRNGKLIGSTFRDFNIRIEDANVQSNNSPEILPIELVNNASWDGDTIVFDSSFACIRFAINDPDSVALILLDLDLNDYDSSDFTFAAKQSAIYGTDTFRTKLCFEPDSLVNRTTSVKLVAFNPGCYDPKSDTMEFYFRFDQLSGLSSNITREVKIYPNPANDVLSISGLKENEVFEVFDIHGKLKKTCIAKNKTDNINIGDLSNGIYILKSENFREKVIVLHE